MDTDTPMTPYIELVDSKTVHVEKPTKVSHKYNYKLITFNLSQCSSINIRSFWITTLTFWLCFFVWFGNIYLIPWIIKDIHLSATEMVVSKSMLTVSALIFRILIGDLLPKIGSRYCYILIMIIAAIPTCLLYFINTSTQYILCNLFIGIIGSSFVITQYHTSQFFDTAIIGLANGTSAGWGNVGGGSAAVLLTLLATYNINWRILTLLSGLLLVIPILLYYFCTTDTLNGNLNYKDKITLKNLKNMQKLKEAMYDYRTWILFVIYASCFGVKTTIMQYITDYFAFEFNLAPLHCSVIIFGFSSLNLFARPMGGFISDTIHKKYGIKARIYVLFLILFFESIFLLIFAFGTFNLPFSVVIMGFFGFFLENAAGVTFGIVPFIQSNNIGPLYGIVGSGGTFGSFFFGITIFYFTSTNQLQYQYAFIIISLFVLFVAFLSLKIKFPQTEMNHSNSDLLTEINKLKNDLLYLQDEKKEMVEEITTLRTRTMDNMNYKEWSHKEVLTWILSLENKIFVQYEDTLNKTLTDKRICGNDLNQVQNKNDLLEWGIRNSGLQKILFQHISELTNSDQEGSNYHINNVKEGTDYVQ